MLNQQTEASRLNQESVEGKILACDMHPLQALSVIKRALAWFSQVKWALEHWHYSAYTTHPSRRKNIPNIIKPELVGTGVTRSTQPTSRKRVQLSIPKRKCLVSLCVSYICCSAIYVFQYRVHVKQYCTGSFTAWLSKSRHFSPAEDDDILSQKHR